MSKIVGIDLGTTNSLVATVDSGIPLVIADTNGQRLTPCSIAAGKIPARRLGGVKHRHTKHLRPPRAVVTRASAFVELSQHIIVQVPVRRQDVRLAVGWTRPAAEGRSSSDWACVASKLERN